MRFTDYVFTLKIFHFYPISKNQIGKGGIYGYSC